MNPITRRKARECAVQAIYSWQLSNNNIIDIKNEFLKKITKKEIDIIYFCQLIIGITDHYKFLDKFIKPYISKKIKKLDPIEKAVLRLSLYELIKRKDIPYKVAINEGIELAKLFGAKKSHKFVNGVLDKVVSKLKKS
ncbi:transcription antitermination factor NusB [Buchnera aphidicola (Mindarus keteleerifoliae)]|uniref:transcription antitermination factor NusB n=1 Tax=Buchnera aphidicola TaxID=9 RepID=UPI0031B6F5FB